MPTLRLAFLALLLLGALPASLLAQTAIVDNRAASNTSGDPLDTTGLASAHAFTTGAAEYKLHSVSVTLKLYAGSNVAVKLWSGSGNAPETVVEDLGTISNAPGGTSNVLFTSTTKPTLAANTRYWVSVANLSGNFDWNLTTSTANFGSGAAFDNLSRESSNGGTTWPNAGVAGEFHQFAVFGTVFRPGNVDAAFGANGKGANAYIHSIAVQPDGKILLGGNFTTVSDANGTHNRSRIARFHANGSVDTTFSADGKGADGFVTSVAIQPDGKIVLGGNFTTVSDGNGTHDRNYIARLNADGSVDAAFGADGKGANSFAYSVAVQADGKILLAGNFTSVSDAASTHSRNFIARLNPDGSVDSSFGADGKGTNGSVSSVAVQPDGKILLGGNFSTVSDASATHNRYCIARLHADGSVDPDFGTDGTGTSESVTSVAVQADGKILLGGFFTTVSDAIGSRNRSFIARLNADGSVDTNFGWDGEGTDGTVISVAVQADGKILLGGEFSTVSDANGTHNRNGIARFNPDGSVDSSFGADGEGTNSSVSSIAVQTDGKVFLGGDFTTLSDANGTFNRKNLARLENGAATSQPTLPDLTRVRWLRGGTAPEVDRVIAEVSLDNGVTYTFLGNASRIPGGWELSGVKVPAICVLRLRAFFANGGSGSGIIEFGGGVLRTKSPLLTLRGKSKLTTSKGRLTLAGTASDPDGDLTAVRYQDSGGKWLTATGTANWTAKAKLKPGRNTILIAAYDSRNVASAIVSVKVKRR